MIERNDVFNSLFHSIFCTRSADLLTSITRKRSATIFLTAFRPHIEMFSILSSIVINAISVNLVTEAFLSLSTSQAAYVCAAKLSSLIVISSSISEIDLSFPQHLEILQLTI